MEGEEIGRCIKEQVKLPRMPVKTSDRLKTKLREMAQSKDCLLCTQENLSTEPQDPHKNAFNSSAGKEERGDAQSQLASLSSLINQF